jgi:hypothetical protein
MNEKIEIDLDQIERDLTYGLDNNVGGEDQKNSSGSSDKNKSWDGQDFISDSNMRFVLGYKNSFLVSILAKGLGKTTTEMLKALYLVTNQEVSIYKRVTQEFINEYFPEYIEKISKISNGDLAALVILEVTRWHEARMLLKVERSHMVEVEVIK